MSEFKLPTYPSMDDLRNLRDWLNENLDKPNIDFDNISFNHEIDFDWSDSGPDSILFTSFDVEERKNQEKSERARREQFNKQTHMNNLIHESRQLRESLTSTQNHLTRAEFKLAKISKGMNNPACKDKPAFLLSLKKATDCVQNLKNTLAVLQAKATQLDAKLEQCC